MKYVPNILTLIRLAMIPVFIWIFFSQMEQSRYLALAVYAFASFTDFVDGQIARRFNVVSELGKVLDPLADKLLQITVVVSFFFKGYIPWYIPAIVLIKEAFMIVSGLILYNKKTRVVIPANWYGKIATVVFTASIILMFFFPGNTWVLGLMIAAMVLRVVAIISYVYTYRRLEQQ